MEYYVIDAFASEVFKGNPAGVCLPEQNIDETLMQNIAAENNLSETAFLFPAPGGYDLRWFTPDAEIDLCGHATLASAFVIRNFVCPGMDQISFFTKSGTLSVSYQDGLYELDFPSRPPKQIDIIPEYAEAAGCEILEAHLSRDLLLLVENESTVKNLVPHFNKIRGLIDCLGIIVTAKGDEVDFVSRFFEPSPVIPEDPVTGSSHCTLIPFWSERLHKDTMIARQLSRRGGTLNCKNQGERVKISGHAVLYLKGTIQPDCL